MAQPTQANNGPSSQASQAVEVVTEIQKPAKKVKPRLICLYGESGIGKTSQCYHLARYLYQTYGAKGRMIGANPSDSAPFEDSGMIEKGVVDFFDISARELALADLRRLATGYWPRTTKEHGDKGYFQTDDICLTKPEEWKQIRFIIVEGITGISNLLIQHIRGSVEGVGFKQSYQYQEDGYIIGGLQEGHYGIIQQEIYGLIVQGFATLPVDYVIFTALTGKGDDKRKEPVYGPKSAGQATTFEIPSWFMDCFHIESVQENDGNGHSVDKRVAWYTRHEDPQTQIPYLARLRVLPEVYPLVQAALPNGYLKLGFNRGIDKMYELIGKLKVPTL